MREGFGVSVFRRLAIGGMRFERSNERFALPYREQLDHEYPQKSQEVSADDDGKLPIEWSKPGKSGSPRGEKALGGWKTAAWIAGSAKAG